jgi:hypothetical protein
VRVTAPDRVFGIPNGLIVSEAIWDNGLTLLGYLLDNSNAVTVVWRAETPHTQPLRRFAHQVDENGQILSVIDGVPVNWTRPVTSWSIGEIILDPVGVLGEGLTLRLGWYSPRDNVRIGIGNTDYFDIELHP